MRTIVEPSLALRCRPPPRRPAELIAAADKIRGELGGQPDRDLLDDIVADALNRERRLLELRPRDRATGGSTASGDVAGQALIRTVTFSDFGDHLLLPLNFSFSLCLP